MVEPLRRLWVRVLGVLHLPQQREVEVTAVPSPSAISRTRI
jgi:hypothetical protein